MVLALTLEILGHDEPLPLLPMLLESVKSFFISKIFYSSKELDSSNFRDSFSDFSITARRLSRLFLK